MQADGDIRNRGKGARRRGRGAGRKVALAVLLVFVALAGAALGLAAHYPQQALQVVRQAVPALDATDGAGQADVAATSAEPEPVDTGVSRGGDAGGAGAPSSSAAVSADAAEAGSATKRVAAYDDVAIYSPIAMEDVTGVLFHQASYETALVMTTELPEADVEKVSVEHPIRVNNGQVDGTWMDADALHLYRTTDATAMDTSIDVGAKAGTNVYAPVTGTVVLVEKYDLYGYVPDVKIHIQPEGHPELDLVMLHQTDPQVEAGDAVVGGTTPVSKVRDIAKDLTDIQLGFFTAEDDPGNHSHIQVNDADSPGYRDENLKGAYKVK